MHTVEKLDNIEKIYIMKIKINCGFTKREQFQLCLIVF